MNRRQLLKYAEERIAALGLDSSRLMSCNTVVAYDAGPGRVRVADAEELICDSKGSVDAALKVWADWVGSNEEVHG